MARKSVQKSDSGSNKDKPKPAPKKRTLKASAKPKATKPQIVSHGRKIVSNGSEASPNSSKESLKPGIYYIQTPCLNGFGRPELQPKTTPGAHSNDAEALAIGITRFFWPKNELRVCFLDEGIIAGLVQDVQRIAKMWEEGTNLRLNFVNGVDSTADIRITLKPTGMFYSVIGTSGTHGSTLVETMSLGFRPGYNESDVPAERQRLILHEFGHALGLDHEFKRDDPKNKLVNIDAAVAYFQQNGLRDYSASDIKAQFERLHDGGFDTFDTDFDD